MKAALFSLTSVFLCAVANVTANKKLVGVSPFIVAVIIPLAQIVLAIPLVLIMKSSGAMPALPKGNAWLFAASVGALYFFANLCLLNAYKNGITVVAATTMAMLLPVFASIIKFIVDKDLPTNTQLLGWLLAAGPCI